MKKVTFALGKGDFLRYLLRHFFLLDLVVDYVA